LESDTIHLHSELRIASEIKSEEAKD